MGLDEVNVIAGFDEVNQQMIYTDNWVNPHYLEILYWVVDECFHMHVHVCMGVCVHVCLSIPSLF